MRIPVQAPAVLRNRRARLVRRPGRGMAEGRGVRPSQYDEAEGEYGEEEEEENGDYGEGGDDDESVVDSE